MNTFEDPAEAIVPDVECAQVRERLAEHDLWEMHDQ